MAKNKNGCWLHKILYYTCPIVDDEIKKAVEEE